MEISLTNRSAIVTGSARRIGREIARELARSGAAVMINSRSDEAAARATAEEIIAAGGRAAWCLADITDPAAVDRMVQQTADAFGGVDILINNAAVRPSAPFAEITPQAWHETLAVVLDGAFHCAQAALPFIVQSPAGRVISIGGPGGHTGVRNRAHVAVAKAGLAALSRTLAAEYAGRITANVIVPGLIEDEGDSRGEQAARQKRVGMDRLLTARSGRPADIAGMVTFLASDAAAFITGQTIHVSGGMHMT